MLAALYVQLLSVWINQDLEHDFVQTDRRIHSAGGKESGGEGTWVRTLRKFLYQRVQHGYLVFKCSECIS